MDFYRCLWIYLWMLQLNKWLNPWFFLGNNGFEWSNFPFQASNLSNNGDIDIDFYVYILYIYLYLCMYIYIYVYIYSYSYSYLYTPNIIPVCVSSLHQARRPFARWKLDAGTEKYRQGDTSQPHRLRPQMPHSREPCRSKAAEISLFNFWFVDLKSGFNMI